MVCAVAEEWLCNLIMQNFNELFLKMELIGKLGIWRWGRGWEARGHELVVNGCWVGGIEAVGTEWAGQVGMGGRWLRRGIL